MNLKAPRKLDGLLIVDKPVGPSSHDVVARARRALGERRVGHTGTLDPDASGVLPLVIGKATRLARFLSAADKSYDAVVRLGFSTNTYDAAGQPTGLPHEGPLPGRDAIDRALDAYRGTFMQQPPAYSAKKIAGQPSYKLARRADRRQAGAGPETVPPEAPALALAPVRVTTSALDIVSVDGDSVGLRVDCSAGFYVRSLAHDLGARLGVGAHLVALRRVRSGDALLADAVPLDAIEDSEHGRERAAAALIPLSRMLPALPALALTDDGVRHAGHGRDLSPGDFAGRIDPVVWETTANSAAVDTSPNPFRLMDRHGNLVGLAEPARTPGLLHPFVVLM
jgi:tRNA pseudouridine55 synthase